MNKGLRERCLFSTFLLAGCGQPIEIEDDGTAGTSSETTGTTTSTATSPDPSLDSSGDGTTESVDPPPEGGLAPWGFGYVRHPEIVARWASFAHLDEAGEPVDLFAMRQEGLGTTYRGDGANGFETIADVELPQYEADFMRAGDFDGDGDVDVAVFNGYGGDEFTVLLNDGEGSLVDAVVSPIEAFYGYGVSVMRFDEDDAADLFIPDAQVSPEGGIIALGQGDGSFGLGPVVVDLACYFSNSASADLDGDGLDDLVATGSCNAIPQYLPLGIYRHVEGSFGLAQGISGMLGPVSEGSDIRLLDVDDDGDLDIVTPTILGIYVVENEGDGTFADPPVMLAHEFDAYAPRMLPLELGPDGRLGFVLEWRESFVTYHAALIIPDETWTSTTTERLDLGGRIADAADVDGDGAPDLAVLEGDFDNEESPGELAIWLSGG